MCNTRCGRLHQAINLIMRRVAASHTNQSQQCSEYLRLLSSLLRECRTHVAEHLSLLSGSFMQARQVEKEAAQQRVQALELDNAELSQRLVEMKTTEIDRMNDVNKLCDEMMKNARNMERAAAAESSSRQVLGKFFNAGKANGLRQGMTTVRVLLRVCLACGARGPGDLLPSDVISFPRQRVATAICTATNSPYILMVRVKQYIQV